MVLSSELLSEPFYLPGITFRWQDDFKSQQEFSLTKYTLIDYSKITWHVTIKWFKPWEGDIRELKQQRSSATDVNRKWTFCIIGQRVGSKSRVNLKGKETQQYKFVSVKAYKKGEGLTSGWLASPKNVILKLLIAKSVTSADGETKWAKAGLCHAIFLLVSYRLLPVEENFLSKFEVSEINWTQSFFYVLILVHQDPCTDIFCFVLFCCCCCCFLVCLLLFVCFLLIRSEEKWQEEILRKFGTTTTRWEKDRVSCYGHK